MSGDSGDRGLPGPLPAGERLLWQGSPDWRAMALRTFHGRTVAIYFLVLLAWVAFAWLYDGATVGETILAMVGFLVVAAVGLGLVCLLAWLTARTTTYTITDHRIVMSYGIALTMSLNLPFSKVASAAVKVFPDRTADIPLVMAEGEKIAYLLLWPHARPWRFSRPEPSFRAVADGAAVAGILSRALAAAHAQAVPAVASAPEMLPAHEPVATAAAA